MAITPGTRLGPYEIVAAIGAGGMGEVYRARDTKLNRDVAIKVLPELFALDPDRLARFTREAQTLASLNHPNIAAIYGIEDRALVMELVEGDDLSVLIARGPIPLAEALSITKQIAEALEAAHEQGIVHRDLKPANIKVRDDGTVKVLDFGLAKAMDPAGASSGEAMNSPTLTMRATQLGVILGTAAYMAPEQAKGRSVDKRADIWAFGVVLHEMLTGRHLFLADTIPETLAHVMTRQVDLTTLPDATPRRVRELLARCLEKDPKKRLRDIGEARLILEDPAILEPDSAPSSSALGPAPLVAPLWQRAVPWAVAAAATFIALWLWAPWRVVPVPAETRVDIVTPATTQPASFALSPDGRQIVFVASDDKASRLWLRSLLTTTAQPLAGTEGATLPFWSPDSRSVGFFAGGALKRLDLGGGAPQILAPVTNGGGGTWNADGVIVFAPSLSTTLMRVSATGGASAAMTTLGPQQFGHFNPQFLPDGRRLLFTVGGPADVNGVYLGGLEGGSPIRLVPELVGSGVYAPAGWLLWVRTAGSLMAQRLDAGRTALTGEPVTLADGVATDSGSFRGAVSVSATGLVAYRTARDAQRQLTWFDRSGTARGVVGEPDNSLFQPRVSPDGRRVAMVCEVQGNWDLWLLEGPRASRVTFDPNPELSPVWSPDSTRLVYMSRRTGVGGLFHKLTRGAGVEEPLLTTDQVLTPTSWSEDGRFLMYLSIDPKTNADLWVMPMTGEDRKPFVFLRTPFREAYGIFSPDGRWVAYHSNESGRLEVYVRSFVPPGATGKAPTAAGGPWQISTAGGVLPKWRSDGKELYYLNPDGAMMAAPITVTGDSLEPGAPVMLFPTHIFGGGADIQAGRQYDVTRDGRFLINTLLNEAAAPITLLMNWHPEAKK